MAPEPTIELLQSTERYWNFHRARAAEEAAKGDENTLDITIDSAIHITGTRSHHPLLADHKIHGFWYNFIKAAKFFTCNNPKQNTLVRQVLYVREIGMVTAKVRETDAILQTSDGQKAWSDLPCLIEDLETACADDSMSATHRINLQSFIARLTSVGICGDAGEIVSGCGSHLWEGLMLRDGLSGRTLSDQKEFVLEASELLGEMAMIKPRL